jgi:hypothetical protein
MRVFNRRWTQMGERLDVTSLQLLGCFGGGSAALGPLWSEELTDEGRATWLRS